jgi:large subunit ribosomal protein L32
MAVPKRKMSRSNTRSRRAQWKAAPLTLTTCPRCRAARLPHRACPACGAYGERRYSEAIRSEHEQY